MKVNNILKLHEQHQELYYQWKSQIFSWHVIFWRIILAYHYLNIIEVRLPFVLIKKPHRYYITNLLLNNILIALFQCNQKHYSEKQSKRLYQTVKGFQAWERLKKINWEVPISPVSWTRAGGTKRLLHLYYNVPQAQECGQEPLSGPWHMAPVFSGFCHSLDAEKVGHLFRRSEEMGSYPVK